MLHRAKGKSMWYTFEGWLGEARIVPKPSVLRETKRAYLIVNREGKKSWREKRAWYNIFPSYEATRDCLIEALRYSLLQATSGQDPEEYPYSATQLIQMRLRLTELEIEAEQAAAR
jgi:hypothetical protein